MHLIYVLFDVFSVTLKAVCLNFFGGFLLKLKESFSLTSDFFWTLLLK